MALRNQTGRYRTPYPIQRSEEGDGSCGELRVGLGADAHPTMHVFDIARSTVCK